MDLAEIKDKKIAVLLSGGVDSSVVVHEFASLGLHFISIIVLRKT